jgi:hypothetical protein
MKGLDHIPELVQCIQRAFAGTVPLMRGEERDRAVSPIVDQSRGSILRIELKYRQEFNSRDTEFDQVGDLLDQPGISSTRLFLDP